jgi:hypothetical protein
VTQGAFDTTFNGDTALLLRDGFVTHFDPSMNNLLSSTFLGGTTGTQFLFDLQVDRGGCAVVTGTTGSIDFPTTPNAFAQFFNYGGGVAGGDVFLTRFNPSGSGLLYSTYLGGSGGIGYGDAAFGLALDPKSGAAVVAGVTESRDFPTTKGAFDTVFDYSLTNGSEAFITKLPIGPFLYLSGTPRPGGLVRCLIDGAAAPPAGALAQVVLSASGTSGIPLPGGLELPLTSDAVTAFSLRLAARLTAAIDPTAGTGRTAPIPIPLGTPEQRLFAAAFVYDPQTGRVLGVSPPLEVIVRR